jgi:hypothetical protein
MPTEQLDLQVKTPAPEVTPEMIEHVISVLRMAPDRPLDNRRAPGWMTACEISNALGIPTTSFDRRVRAIASAAMPEIVSYPGSPGYKLFGRCTIEEIQHCISAFQSQGTDMLKRSVVYSAAYHRRHRNSSQAAS